ncbi:MAG: restriction endonuclease [Proteobacteria bacterium]|nr:MAG: restriction endonuclease [Pseudomonadota bacterium]
MSSVTDIGGLLSIGLMYAIVPRFRRKGLLGLTLGFASHKTRVLLRRGMRGIAARMKVVPAVGLALSAASFVFAFSVSTYPLALGLSVTGLSLAVGWPVYRGLRAAINRRPLRGQSFDVERYGINGKRSVLDMLKRSVRSDKDDVLRDAFKNPIWTENRHLPDAERHGVYKRFEETVTLSLRELNLDAMHYGVANARAFGHKGSGDGGIDVLVPAGKTPKMIIQCKCYGDVVSISDVKALHSTVSSKAHAGALGVLVTTKGFTEDARRFAKENNIGLTTLDELIKLSR